MRGRWGKKIARKSRNSCRVNSRSCGCIGTVDSGPKCAHSWNQIQMLKQYLFCHIYCAHLWTRVAAIVTASCAVSNREFIERTPPPRGGFVFPMFPHQEPCVRGPPSKNLVQILRRGSSYTRLLIREHSLGTNKVCLILNEPREPRTSNEPRTLVVPRESFKFKEGDDQLNRCGSIAISEEGYCDGKMRWDPVR